MKSSESWRSRRRKSNSSVQHWLPQRGQFLNLSSAYNCGDHPSKRSSSCRGAQPCYSVVSYFCFLSQLTLNPRHRPAACRRSSIAIYFSEILKLLERNFLQTASSSHSSN